MTGFGRTGRWFGWIIGRCGRTSSPPGRARRAGTCLRVRGVQRRGVRDRARRRASSTGSRGRTTGSARRSRTRRCGACATTSCRGERSTGGEPPEGAHDGARRRAGVGDIRGLGLMIGIELVADRESKRPFARAEQVTEQVLAAAREQRAAPVLEHRARRGRRRPRDARAAVRRSPTRRSPSRSSARPTRSRGHRPRVSGRAALVSGAPGPGHDHGPSAHAGAVTSAIAAAVRSTAGRPRRRRSGTAARESRGRRRRRRARCSSRGAARVAGGRDDPLGDLLGSRERLLRVAVATSSIPIISPIPRTSPTVGASASAVVRSSGALALTRAASTRRSREAREARARPPRRRRCATR